MTILAFPSEEFPAPPAITILIPADWKPVHSPGALVATCRRAEEGTFVPNVVVRIERRPAAFQVTDALDELRQYVAQRPQGTISPPFKVELDGLVLIGCDLSWVDDQVGTVLQAHLFGALSLTSSVQLVQVTGSVGGAQARQDYPSVKAIMKSPTVSAAEPGGGR